MEAIFAKYHELRRLKWTKTTLTIFALPIVLLFTLLHLTILMLEESITVVVSDSDKCNEIGKAVLSKGGSVVDSAVSIIFCESLLVPRRIGIGAGFSAIIYMQRKFDTIVALPRAPAYVKTGYVGNNNFNKSNPAAIIAVPGSLQGCWEMHKKYGLLSWQSLIEPTIKLCEDGVHEDVISRKEEHGVMYESVNSQMSQTSEKSCKNYKKASSVSDEVLKFPILAHILRAIAKEGPDTFYKGSIGENIINDIKNKGGQMQLADFVNYTVTWDNNPIRFRLHGEYKAYTTPLPTSGAIVALVIKSIRRLPNHGSALFWHQTIEAMKHAYGLSYTLADIDNEENAQFVRLVRDTYEKMIDDDFAAQLRNTLLSIGRIKRNLSFYGAQYNASYRSSSANICIINRYGDAIALTAGMAANDDENLFYSEKADMLFNNELKNFFPYSRLRSKCAVSNDEQLPPSPNSYIRAGKRPFSSHCPTIVVNSKKSKVYLVASASGDETAPAQLITLLIKKVFEKKNLLRATNSWFFYPDVLEGRINLQAPTAGLPLSKEVFKFLKDMGHNLSARLHPYAIRSAIYMGQKPTGEYTYQQTGGVDRDFPKQKLDIFVIFILVSCAIVALMTLCIEIVRATKKQRSKRNQILQI